MQLSKVFRSPRIRLAVLVSFSLLFGCDDDPAPSPVDMMLPDMEIDMELPRCGDGIVNQEREQCDDGNDDDQDECLSHCELARCGDGVIQRDVEACDDGNDESDDRCVNCQLSRCGDGVLRRGGELGEEGFEECDDGNDDETDACLSTCRLARCGDGVVQEGLEECDDGNDDNQDECTSSCVLNICGDGLLRRGVEECDDGDDDDQNGCTTTCALNICGDGILYRGVERCDDGDENSDAGRCTTRCVLATCGDGLLRTDLDEADPSFEACDDGNEDDLDSCRTNCSLAYCGDGLVRRDLSEGSAGFEACDPANPDPDAPPCDHECVLIECGNGKVQAEEECDVGIEGDETCDSECVLIECGNGKRQAEEACDWGEDNSLESDHCRPDCTQPTCGDSIHDPLANEECDEGPVGGDACRANCILKRCGDRIIDASIGEVCDDGNRNETDECLSTCQANVCGDGILRVGPSSLVDYSEDCDWGEDNRAAPDHCRLDCTLPRCGDGIVDEAEACDDADADENNGCNSSCEVSFCGNLIEIDDRRVGELNSYLLASGTRVESCEGLVGCVTEECEIDGNFEGCDVACSLSSYSLRSGDLKHPLRVAIEDETDTYEFELTADAFVHFVARNSLSPFTRCEADEQRTLRLIRLDDQGDVQMTPLFEGAHLEDEGVCGALQAQISAGRYRLEVGGAGDRHLRYTLRSYLSQAIDDQGEFTTELTPVGEQEGPSTNLYHFTVDTTDLTPDVSSRIARFIFHSSDLKESSSEPDCPNISLVRAIERSSISDIERPSSQTTVQVTPLLTLRDELTCAYEVMLSKGFYQLSLPTQTMPYHTVQYQWADQCGNGTLDAGEGCDLGLRSSAFPCSSICQADPVETEGDGVCDPLESRTVPQSSDCELTCSQADQGCDVLWNSAIIDQRVSHLKNEARILTFTVEHPQVLEASLTYCSDPSVTLELLDSENTVIQSDMGGGRERCASLSTDLLTGTYQLRVSATGADGDIISYWMEAVRYQALDQREFVSSKIPLGADQESQIETAFELSITQRENVEVRVFDDDHTLQCESKNSYTLTLYSLDSQGRLKRELDGALKITEMAVTHLSSNASGTANYAEEIPCLQGVSVLSPGRYIVGLNGPDEATFIIQALRPRYCGNGVLDLGEECDDANLQAGDGCTKYCIKEPRCGDGVLDRGELCDDGNQEDNDLTCSSLCTYCGDGQLQEGEECDDGNVISGDGCDRMCSKELIPIHNAITHHQGTLLQPVYREEDAPDQQRTLADRADVYTFKVSRAGRARAVLCAQGKRNTNINNTDARSASTQLVAKASLYAIEDPLNPLDGLDSIDHATAEAVTQRFVFDRAVDAPILPRLNACEGDLSPQPERPIELITDEQAAQWRDTEGLWCIELDWGDQLTEGEYALVIEAVESWPVYRDHPIFYDLNVMIWRDLWQGASPELGILKGDLPPQGDVLFRLTREADSDEGLFEVRTLDNEHFSCPINTSTTLYTFTPEQGSEGCSLYSKLPEESSCASTRVTLNGGGEYYFLLQSRDFEDGLARYGVKVRNIDKCGTPQSGNPQEDWGEECDDGNLIDNDACSKVCTFTYLLCGNGEIDAGEQCDDGNDFSEDGCSALCKNERDTLWLERAWGANLRPSDKASELSAALRELFHFINHPVIDRDHVTGQEVNLSEGQLTLSLTPKDGYSVKYKLCDMATEATCEWSNGSLSANCNHTQDPISFSGGNLLNDEGNFKSCSLEMSLEHSSGLSSTEPYRISYHRTYSVDSSAQLFGRLRPFASDVFKIDLTVDELFPSTPQSPDFKNVMIQLSLSDPSVYEFAPISDPPCPEGLDTYLALYTHEAYTKLLSGEMIDGAPPEPLIESDDVSATNLCSSFFTILTVDYTSLDANINTYYLKVESRSLATSGYQLQVSYPELCGNGIVNFGEDCDALDNTDCEFCRLISDSE